MPRSKNAQQNRLDMFDNLGPELWADVAANSLRAEYPRGGHHRWFDGGDIQSVAMLRAINKVAHETPMIRHWIPTQERAMVREFGVRNLAENLVVRISAVYIDQPARGTLGLPWSTTSTGPSIAEHHCPADEVKPASCGTCRACWDPSIESVQYKLKHAPKEGNNQ